MARPSQQLDALLLESGRALYPQLGAIGLSVRVLAEHAGVNPGMFHYHFKSKDNFLRALLAGLYEEMFADIRLESAQHGTALERLQGVLVVLARFLRNHRAVIVRVWMDALGGEPVAREFLCGNAPRHLGLLLELLGQAQREGQVAALHPAQQLAFLLGAVGMPIVFGGAMADAGLAPAALRPVFDLEVMSDAAIATRVTLALQALRLPA